jgi:hypothetical protein
MLKLIGRAGLAAVLLVVPAIAAAQHDMAMGHEAKHELGADITAFYQRLSLAGQSSNQILIGTPVDLRLGVPVGAKGTVEPRINFAFHSKGSSAGGAAYELIPDVNLTWGFQDNKKGPYLTAGAAIRIEHDTSSLTQFGFNGGIGTRIPYESGAIRVEAFDQYFLKKTADALPNELNIGVRIGLSLWH